MGFFIKKVRDNIGPSDDATPSKRAAIPAEGLSRQKWAALGLLGVVAFSLLGVFTFIPNGTTPSEDLPAPDDSCFEYYFDSDGDLASYLVGDVFIIRDLAVNVHFTAIGIVKPLYVINCTFSPAKTLKFFDCNEVHVINCTIGRTLNAKFNDYFGLKGSDCVDIAAPLVKNTVISISENRFIGCELEISQSSGGVLSNYFAATEVEFLSNIGITVALNDFSDITAANFADYITVAGYGVDFSMASIYSDHILGNLYAVVDPTESDQLRIEEYGHYFPNFDTSAAGIFISPTPIQYDSHPLGIFTNAAPSILIETEAPTLFEDSTTVNVSISGLIKAWAWAFDAQSVETPTWTTSVFAQIPITVSASGFYAFVVNATNIFDQNVTATAIIAFDIDAPIINGFTPANNTMVGLPVPAYSIDIEEANLASITLTADGIEYPISITGIIPADAWAYAVGQGGAEFLITATDLGGHSESAYWVLVIDSSSPDVIIIAPEAATYKTAPIFTIIASEPIILSEVRLNGLIAPDIANNTVLTGFDALKDGSIAIQAIGTDLFGNPFTAAQTIIKDTTPPEPTIQAPAVASDAPIIVIGCEDGTVAEIAVEIEFANGTVFPIGTIIPGSTVDISNHWINVANEESIIIRVACVDGIGNVGSSEFSIAKDIKCPDIIAQCESGDRVLEGASTQTFSITTSDFSTLNVFVQINDGDMDLIEIGDNGVVEIPTEKFIEGVNRVQFIAIDQAGNANSTALYIYSTGNPALWDLIKSNISENWLVYLVGVVALTALFVSLSVKKKMEAK